MEFLIYSGEYDTPTDGIIYRGIETILKHIYPNCNFSYLPKSDRFFRDCTAIPDELAFPNKKFDAIIIPGSPWLWDQFHKTWKIKNLLRCKELHPEAKIIWFGIGSCLPLNNTNLLYTIEHQLAIKSIFKDDLVIVRDSLAQSIMAVAEVDSYLLKCPSYYSCSKPQITPVKGSKLIVYYEPSIGLSKSLWQNTAQLSAYYDIFKEYAKQNYDIVVKDSEEVEFAEKLGLKTPRILVDSQDTIDTVGKYEEVLSGRVHCAIPALASGCKVRLIPIDTRAKTAGDFVDCLDKFNILNPDVLDYMAMYKKLITEFLG